MASRGETYDGNSFWDIVGSTFVAALNDGLARAGPPTLRARSGTRLVSRSHELPHPFAAAVMRAFETALPGAEGGGSPAVLASLQQRGHEMLAAALGLPPPQGQRQAHGTTGPLLPRHEHLVVTLLMESAALVLSERPELGDDGRPAALVRALGRWARSGRAGG
ncbi:hypothetical protein [Streptomyces sp. NPDC058579]|uniref:hypothetical protein n=1 Tax=Streptomyces sp. NPDC058579 TaxID=3346548 RepID=UPI00365B43C7